MIPQELIRSTDADKTRRIEELEAFKARNSEVVEEWLAALQRSAVHGENIFASLLETSKVASLGEMSNALYDVGGQYRRNM